MLGQNVQTLINAAIRLHDVTSVKSQKTASARGVGHLRRCMSILECQK